MKKRGLSPVIATVLLVGIAVVLAVIVFLWAMNFVGEKIEKEGRAIELLCEDVSFTAEAYELPTKAMTLYVENSGSVPLYGMELRKKNSFGTEILESKYFSDSSLVAGETGEIGIDSVSNGETLVVVPMLLGEVKGKTKKLPYICDADYGLEIVVG